MTIKIFELTDSETQKALKKLASKTMKRKADRERAAAKRQRAQVDKAWALMVGTVEGKLIKPLKTPRREDLDLRKSL